MNLKQFKSAIKKDKKVLITKPVHLLVLPLILVSYIYVRFKKTTTTIYLLEMELCYFDYDSEIYNCKVIRNYLECKEIINKRISEEGWMNDYIEIVKRRFNRGDYMIMLFDGTIPVSFLFVSSDKAELNPIDLTIDLPKGTFAIYDVYTLKDYRNKGYYRNLFKFTVNYHYKLGYKKSYLWLMRHNKVSIISHNNLGMKNVIEEITEVRKYFTKKILRKKVNYNSINLIE